MSIKIKEEDTFGVILFLRLKTSHLSPKYRVLIGHTIDKKLLSTINKMLIDKLSIRSFCY